MILGFAWQVLVMFGMHWAIIPFAIIALSSGQPTMLLTPMGSVSFAQTGAVIAVMMKTKNAKLKELSIPAIISGIFGVTEPAIYGITLPKKRPFWASCIVGAVTGAIAMALQIPSYQMGGLGVFRYTSMISPDGGLNFVIYSVILDVVAVIASFALAYVLGFDDDAPTIAMTKNEAKDSIAGKKLGKQEAFSPVEGKILPLNQAKDAAFSEGIMGKGVVVEPTIGVLLAPFDGIVMSLFPTKHAIGLISDDGMELLIHIGIDTVQLNGEHFEAFVTQNEKVKKGQKMINFDIPAIEAAGFSTQIPIIVTNTNDYEDVIATTRPTIKKGELLMTAVTSQ